VRPRRRFGARLTLRALSEAQPAVLALFDRLGLDATAKARLLRAVLERGILTLDAIASAVLDEFDEDGGRAELAAAQRELLLGEELLRVPSSRLVVGALIGSGSFGDVHRVTFHGRELALKTLRLAGLSEAAQREVVRSARREARVLQQLKHAHVIEFVGMVVDDVRSIGLLMELSTLGNLRQKLDATALPLEQSAQMRIATGIADGMAYLHSSAVLHHDLKSANVLLFEVEGKCTPKLADFGLAVVLNSSTMSTRRGAAGSTAYKAPEQFDDEMTPKSEVYSFAIILWELLHGNARPWDGKSDTAILGAVCRARRPPVSDELCDSVLRQCMERSWEQEPDERPSFEQLLTRLRAAARTFGTSSFKRQYAALQSQPTALITDEVMVSTRALILEHAQRHGFSSISANDYFLAVRQAAFTASAHGHSGAAAVNEVLSDPHLFAVRMYASALQLGGASGPELCSILNAALREDRVDNAMPLAHTLNKRLVTRGTQHVRWPADNTVWRGGALPSEHRHFYVEGKQYRVPMFLSTTESRATAERFLVQRGAPQYVLWQIKLDPVRRCVHVNHIDRHDATLGLDPNTGPENEYLFAPYSTFTVLSCQWQAQPTSANPHRVTLRAAVDNSIEDENLPLAPWA